MAIVVTVKLLPLLSQEELRLIPQPRESLARGRAVPRFSRGSAVAGARDDR